MRKYLLMTTQMAWQSQKWISLFMSRLTISCLLLAVEVILCTVSLTS